MPKTIKRNCVICGSEIEIHVDDKGHYDNGYYFGNVTLPKGRGEYKQVGTSKVFEKEHPVIEWTGETTEAEYWECNRCYERSERQRTAEKGPEVP